MPSDDGDPVRPATRRFRFTPVHAIWAAFIAAALAAGYAAMRDVGPTLTIVRGAYWPLLLTATVVESAYLLTLALFMTHTFRATGLPARLRRFVPLSLASHFVNVISKSGGLAGIALYARESRGEKYSAQQSSVAYLVQHFLGYLAYFAVLTATLVLLYLHGSLHAVELAASVVVISLGAGIVVVGWYAVRSAARLERLMVLAGGPINGLARRIGRGPVIPLHRARDIAAEFHATVRAVMSRPARYLFPLVFALLVELLSVVILLVLAAALHAHISFVTAMAVYAISLLFSMIAITPAGVGFVEASMTFLLVSFGVDVPHAIAITVAFRLFDLWIPLAFGALSLAIVYRGGQPGKAPALAL